MIGKTYSCEISRLVYMAGLVLFWLICVPGRAGAEISFAKFAGEFLSTGVGARPLGMGGAFAALADDGTAGYWNPAGLASIAHTQISVMHAERFNGEVNYDYAGLAIPMKKRGTLSVMLIRLGIDNIPDTRDALLDFGLDGIPGTNDEGEGNGILDPSGERLDISRIRYFSNADYAFFASFAKSRTERLAYGATMKLIRRAIGENSAYGIGFDAGVRWRAGNRLLLGANLMDVTSTLVAWDTGRRELISPTLKIGAALPVDLKSILGGITPLLDADFRFDNRGEAAQVSFGRASIDMHYGAELNISKRVFLRAGYDDIKRFTAGAGVYVRNFNIDYSFASFNDIAELGDTHRLSVTFTLQNGGI